MEVCFLTLFPESFGNFLGSSLLGKAQESGRVSYRLVQIRDFAQDKHRTVDDTPYGGGEGMLLRGDVLYGAWKSVKREGIRSLTILLSPQGALFDQDMAKELAGVSGPAQDVAQDVYDQLILVCGHYEGVDERFIDLCVDREVSVGNYVLTGGELPALVIAETVTRLLPGVVGNAGSLTRDSLEGDLLKYPQYTRPREFEGLAVPEVLLSGDHGKIERWREMESRARTANKRPDLLKKR